MIFKGSIKIKGNTRLVCKLQQSLYGLKQASRQWNLKFTECLLQLGFVQSKAYCSLFSKHTQEGFIDVLVYVDDIIISSKNQLLIDHFKASLSKSFKLKDLGNLQYFLGVEIARSMDEIITTQRKFVLEMLEEYGLLGAKPTSITMGVNANLTRTQENCIMHYRPLWLQTTYWQAYVYGFNKA